MLEMNGMYELFVYLFLFWKKERDAWMDGVEYGDKTGLGEP